MINKMIENLKFNKLTPIQEQMIESYSYNRNIVALAPTGTGKTHSYLLPVIADIKKLDLNYVHTLIIVPTNELVMQVTDMINEIDHGLSVRSYHATANKEREDEFLSNNTPDIIITTPSQIKYYLFESKTLSIRDLKNVIFDEADMMMEMQFLGDIDEILNVIKDARFILLSATMTQNLEPFIKSYFGSYALIDTNDKHELDIAHYLFNIQNRDRLEYLLDLVKSINPYMCLIFVNKREHVKEVFELIHSNYPETTFLSGDLPVRVRKNRLNEIRTGRYQYIITSDLASRGIDLDVSDVINFDLPYELVYFRHRSGRTGRMNRSGNVYTLFAPNESRKIERLRNQGFDFIDSEIIKGEVVRRARKLTKEDQEILQAIRKVRKPKRVTPNWRKKNKKKMEKAIKKERIKRYKWLK